MTENPPLPCKSLSGTKSIVSGDNTEMQESQACHHFSIRGYVSEVQKIDRNMCWPFNPTKELPDLVPPMILPNFRWWGCKSCLCTMNKIDEDSESIIPNASKRDDWTPKGQLSPIEENPDPLHERENDVDQERNLHDSKIPNASKRDDWMSEGHLSPIEENHDPLHEREKDVDQERNIQDFLLPDASKSCLYKIYKIDKDSDSILPDASKRDEWISEGQLSTVEDQDPLHERENDVDQECNIEDSILPDASESCLYKVDKIFGDNDSTLSNASKREDWMPEGQLSPTEEDQDPLHERENDVDQECDIQDSTTVRANLGCESTETDLPTKSGNDDDVAVENEGVPGSNSSVERINKPDVQHLEGGHPGSSNLYYSRRPRKLRRLADILKDEASCPSGEMNLSKQDEFRQKREGTDNIEDNPLGDEQSVPQFRGKKKFPSRKRRYFPGGERKGPFSFKIILKRSEKPKTQRLGRVHKRAKKLEGLEEIKANISKNITTAAADIVVAECEASILSSQAITTPTEKRSVEEWTGVSEESEGGNSVRTLGKEEKAAVYETNPIMDDVPIEILELLQSNFQKKNQQNLGHSAAEVARSSGINNETRDSRISYLQHHSLPGGGESSKPGRAPGTSKNQNQAKDRPFIYTQNKPIEAHLDPDPFPALYPCRCFSKVNSCAGLTSEKGNYEPGSKETLSAMQLLRLMDPAVPLNLKRDVGSFDSFVAQNRDTPDQASSLGMTSLNSFTTFGNFPSLDGLERLSLNSRKKRRIKNPDSAGRQGNKSTSNSIQFEFKNKGGAADPLRGGQPELGFCALNMNPADFYTVNARSKLYMISYKDLGPKMKKQPVVFPDFREREMLPEG